MSMGTSSPSSFQVAFVRVDLGQELGAHVAAGHARRWRPGSARGCRSSWRARPCSPGAPGWCGCRSPLRAGAWRRNGALHQRLVNAVAALLPCPSILPATLLGKGPLPTALGGRVRVLPVEGVRQEHAPPDVYTPVAGQLDVQGSCADARLQRHQDKRLLKLLGEGF
jgi:hypothetical protein